MNAAQREFSIFNSQFLIAIAFHRTPSHFIAIHRIRRGHRRGRRRRIANSQFLIFIAMNGGGISIGSWTIRSVGWAEAGASLIVAVGLVMSELGIMNSEL